MGDSSPLVFSLILLNIVYIVWAFVSAYRPDDKNIANIVLVDFLVHFLFLFIQKEWGLFADIKPITQFLILAIFNFISLVFMLIYARIWYIYIAYLIPLLYCSFAYIGYHLPMWGEKHTDVAYLAWRVTEANRLWLADVVAISQIVLLLIWFKGRWLADCVMGIYHNYFSNRRLRVWRSRLSLNHPKKEINA